MSDIKLLSEFIKLNGPIPSKGTKEYLLYMMKYRGVSFNGNNVVKSLISSDPVERVIAEWVVDARKGKDNG